MAETANIAAVANKLSHEIFRVFHWDQHPQHDANFGCVVETHETESGKRKLTHPADVVFHYIDPYINKRVYLHTDLKSYGGRSLQVAKVREALHSLAMTIECANVSESWREKFAANEHEPYEIHGLLFVSNHDGKAPELFDDQIRKIPRRNIPLASGQAIHVLGPKQISGLYSIATDIQLMIASQGLSKRYRFFYPDQTIWKRGVADDERIGGTIETLMSPYFIIKHDAIRDSSGALILQQGSIVYYSRAGDTVDEFVYLLDSLSRYQLFNSNTQVRVRVFNRDRSPNLMNNFRKAKAKYCSEWGFEGSRTAEIEAVSIEVIQHAVPNYSPDEIGWREG